MSVFLLVYEVDISPFKSAMKITRRDTRIKYITQRGWHIITRTFQERSMQTIVSNSSVRLQWCRKRFYVITSLWYIVSPLLVLCYSPNQDVPVSPTSGAVPPVRSRHSRFDTVVLVVDDRLRQQRHHHGASGGTWRQLSLTWRGHRFQWGIYCTFEPGHWYSLNFFCETIFPQIHLKDTT